MEVKTCSSYPYKLSSLSFFKVFRSEKGWPFPKFYGACGRAIIMEDAGLPLDSFLSHPWLERAELALAVIKIAKQLTSNLDYWGLYLTEIALDNFAVSNGIVRLEDASHILVVDLLESNIKGNVHNVCLVKYILSDSNIEIDIQTDSKKKTFLCYYYIL